jgi:phospholipase/carboxylesterase
MLDLPLHHRHRPASSVGSAPDLLVLMHGVGSNEEDLFGLAPWVPPNFHLISLQAPISMGAGAYGWFEFGMGAGGQRVINTAHEMRSRSLVAEAVQTAASQLSVPASRVIVGGFSQGGIMALTLLLTQPDLLGAACAMHSRLLSEAVASQVPAQKLNGRRLWLSYGTEDAVLAPSFTEAIAQHVKDLPITVRMQGYPGGHGLGPGELTDWRDWLLDCSSQAQSS